MKILLGVCGSIAAYKSALLVRLLVKNGHDVQVIMTEGAKAFIGPLTLATLSNRPVLSEYYDAATGEWTNHVKLSEDADLLLIAPASSNELAKLAGGHCDNLLLGCYLSATCPVYIAPAMDRDMYLHPATQHNIKLLRQRGNIIIEPESGELASGLVGKGRMAEPENIVAILENNGSKSLSGRSFIVTAGPTYEAIDPVRFIGNRSSGKMGYAIAQELADRGAVVTLVSGPTALSLNHPNITLIDIRSAEEMYEAVRLSFPTSDGAVMSAAVADFTPAEIADRKIKKKDGQDEMTIHLKKTRDILKFAGSIKRPEQILVGFSLETDNELANARKKLEKKGADMIVLNSLQDAGAGFGHDTNKVTFVKPDGIIRHDLKSKQEVAVDIVDEMVTLLKLK